MAKLENKLRRVWGRIANETYRTETEFYSLVHQFDRLKARYEKAYGVQFNPHREGDGWEGDLVNQDGGRG